MKAIYQILNSLLFLPYMNNKIILNVPILCVDHSLRILNMEQTI